MLLFCLLLRETMFLSRIKNRFSTKAPVKVRLWCDINYKMRINILQRNYWIECSRNDVLPRKIFNSNSKFNEFSFHNNFCERKFQHSLNSFKCSLLSLKIKDTVLAIKNSWEFQKIIAQRSCNDFIGCCCNVFEYSVGVGQKSCFK